MSELDSNILYKLGSIETTLIEVRRAIDFRMADIERDVSENRKSIQAAQADVDTINKYISSIKVRVATAVSMISFIGSGLGMIFGDKIKSLI